MKWLLVVWIAGFVFTLQAQDKAIVIDLSDQRAYLLEGGKQIASSKISSGRPGFETPTGGFRVLEKDPNHTSTEYGKIVSSSGRVLVGDADAGTPVPKGAHFVPAPMHYFLRFKGAYGMHAGRVPNQPVSHGCVRLPRSNAALFYEAATIGTPVTVQH